MFNYKFEAVAPDPAYAIPKGGKDNHVSKQARALQAAGYNGAQMAAFLTNTDSADYPARMAECDSIRLHIHISAKDIGNIRGCTFDPEHIFALAIEMGLTGQQVRNDIMTIKAEWDEANHTDTTPYVDKAHLNVYQQRAEQVKNHGR